MAKNKVPSSPKVDNGFNRKQGYNPASWAFCVCTDGYRPKGIVGCETCNYTGRVHSSVRIRCDVCNIGFGCLAEQWSHKSMHEFKMGAYVRTVKPTKESGDWTQTALDSRKWDVVGKVVDYSDSHGLAFRVEHLHDGTYGWYEARELALTENPGVNNIEFRVPGSPKAHKCTVAEAKALMRALACSIGEVEDRLKTKCPTCRCRIVPGEECMCCAGRVFDEDQEPFV